MYNILQNNLTRLLHEKLFIHTAIFMIIIISNKTSFLFWIVQAVESKSNQKRERKNQAE